MCKDDRTFDSLWLSLTIGAIAVVSLLPFNIYGVAQFW